MAYDDERGARGRGDWDYPGDATTPRRGERAGEGGEGGWPGQRGPGDRGLTGDLGSGKPGDPLNQILKDAPNLLNDLLNKNKKPNVLV